MITKPSASSSALKSFDCDGQIVVFPMENVSPPPASAQ
jgi:hypothetical protein